MPHNDATILAEGDLTRTFTSQQPKKAAAGNFYCVHSHGCLQFFTIADVGDGVTKIFAAACSLVEFIRGLEIPLLVTCAALVQALQTAVLGGLFSVTGPCSGDLQIHAAPPGTVIDFSAATSIVRMDLVNVSGITIKGFVSTGAQYSALNVRNSSQILLEGPRVIGAGTVAITIMGSNIVEVANPWVSSTSGDGIDIAGSTNVNIHDGACDDNILTPGIHPDCVQAWSATGYPIQHVIVQNMTVVGTSQGFDLWDASDFGATDVQFINNHAYITYPTCIGAFNIHQLVITGNDCHALPGAQWGVGLYVLGSPNAVISNNAVATTPP